IVSLSIGCTEDKASAPSTTQSTAPPICGELDLRFEFARDEVPSGAALLATLIAENHSGHAIVDPECFLGAWRFGLIPSDDPSQLLWQAIIADCGRALKMRNGYTGRWTNEFLARTREGDPLPERDYLAAVEIKGRSGRITHPIKIT